MTTRLYLDTEFNGHGGELISLALASEDGKHWYGVMPEPRIWNEWCYEHVFPKLHALPTPATVSGDARLFRSSLAEYLLARKNCTIYADWPADFAHLMQVMCGPSFGSSWVVPCNMVLLEKTDPDPLVPHNALSDAIALMHWHAGVHT